MDTAKRAGIDIVHGFFVVGSPDETVHDIRATFDFAAKLRLDTFGFNRLCVYRGTPLWKEYVARGLVNDTADWYKYFKCSEIDPTCLPGPLINAERNSGLRRLFWYKLTRYPIQTFRLLFRFMRYMPLRTGQRGQVYCCITSHACCNVKSWPVRYASSILAHSIM